MWKMAHVEKYSWGVEVGTWDADGRRLQRLEPKQKRDPKREQEIWSLYNQAIIDLLKEGWEPFNTQYEYSAI